MSKDCLCGFDSIIPAEEDFSNNLPSRVLTLKVWQKSHKLTLEVYAASKTVPKEEMYGLISQMRRSSSSIPTNIAEGCGRGTDADFARFLQNAMGSASELEYQLLLSLDLGYIESKHYESLNIEVQATKRMLAAFLQKLKAES